MRTKPDQAILERAKHFEAQALKEIFDTFSPGIYRYAYRLLGDAELASDCMAETFSRFLNALRKDSGPDNYLQAYLYRIAHNWITDYYRSKVPQTLPLVQDLPADPSDEPHQKLDVALERQVLREALSLLTPDQRQVIVMRYLEGYDHETIAQALNKPVGAVKALQHRGIESLHRILIRYEDVNV
jgi:RNA polymerase sigma-70 factor (ECF subfamily)